MRRFDSIARSVIVVGALGLGIIAGCGGGSDDAAAAAVDAVTGTDTESDVLPGSDAAGPAPDVAEVPDVPACVPNCEAATCAPDGCGGACPACGDLPKAYGTSCMLEGEPPAPGPITLVPAFTGVVFNYPVAVVPHPSGRLLIVEKRGIIKSMPDDPTADGADLDLFLDIESRVESGKPETGLLSVALHPKFSENGQFFVNYTATENSKLKTIISRFTVDAEGRGDATTEKRLLVIDQPYANHNGGQVAFGPDGKLYIGMGDGGAGGDPGNRAQNLGEWLGKMLRIDVDAPTDGLAYGVPTDNPFVGTDGARPEIWAYGLRNPWRFSFDPLTGLLWAGDVGQDLWEEVDIVERGKNYGWKVMEGLHCFKAATCEEAGLTPPVVEYPHNAAGDASITGGFVYRGAAMPALQGTYVFADYISNVIYGVRFGVDGKAELSTLAQTDKLITSFGLSTTGELLATHASPFSPEEGQIYRVVAASADPPTGPTFPRTLSATGCFTDLAALTPAEGLLTYDVNVPLWHDGSASVRFLALPSGGKLAPVERGGWSLPVGAKLIKTFVYDAPSGQRTKVETRFAIVHEDGVRFYTYRWNDAGTDADLLDSAGERSLVVDGVPLTWHFPSRAECVTCHNDAAGRLLGWRTVQLDRPVTLGSVTGGQFHLWSKLGILTASPVPEMPFPSLADASVPVATRARAVLDVNCGTCHRPEGPPVTEHDLRFDTPLAGTKLCNTEPEQGGFGVPGEKLLVPGDPDKSVLLLRMKTLGELHMPGASHVVDEQAVQLVTEWISGLTGCE